MSCASRISPVLWPCSALAHRMPTQAACGTPSRRNSRSAFVNPTFGADDHGVRTPLGASVCRQRKVAPCRSVDSPRRDSNHPSLKDDDMPLSAHGRRWRVSMFKDHRKRRRDQLRRRAARSRYSTLSIVRPILDRGARKWIVSTPRCSYILDFKR